MPALSVFLCEHCHPVVSLPTGTVNRHRHFHPLYTHCHVLCWFNCQFLRYVAGRWVVGQEVTGVRCCYVGVSPCLPCLPCLRGGVVGTCRVLSLCTGTLHTGRLYGLERSRYRGRV